MSDTFLWTFIVVVVIGIILLGIVLVWLVLNFLKLQREYRNLRDLVRGNNNDLAGLCSAALEIDRRIEANDEQLGLLWARLTEYADNEQSEHPYKVVIQKVRGGAGIDELMQTSGLSHDEAALLIRLHGSKGKSLP